MTLPPVARRSLALVAATALLTSGATGLLTGAALAANSEAVTAVSPNATNNSGDTAMTVTGTGFAAAPATPDTANFSLTQPSAYGATTPPLTLSQTQAQKSSNTSTTYSGTLPSTNAAPGTYDVYMSNTANGNGVKCAGCLAIGSSGAPDVTNVTPGADTSSNPVNGVSRGAGAIDVFGRNLAKASFVSLRLPGTNTADPEVKFTVRDPNASGAYAGYESSSVIRGNYTETSQSFTPGKHLVVVTNTAGETGSAGELWLPKFAASGVSPTTFGAGVTNKVITVVGQGIRQGSRLDIQNLASPLDQTHIYPDVTVGATTVSADGTTISAPVSFASDAQAGTPRAVSISGPDGGSYAVANVVTVTPAPTISGFSPNTLGQGGTVDVAVSGTGFAAGTTPANGPTFTVGGTGVTAKLISSTNAQATVRLIAASDAPTGSRTVTVTNPDGGSMTYTTGSNNAPILTIDAGPTISSVSPPSSAAGTSKTITIKGLNFDGPPAQATGKPTIQFSVPPAPGGARQADSSVSVGSVTVTKGTNGAADTVTFTLSIAGNAPAGPRDIVLTNPSDSGAVLCSGCFGVDSLTVAPTSGANTGTKSVTFTAANAIPAGSTVRLTKAGDATVQPDIAGSGTTINNNALTATFDLTDAATGPYGGVVTLPGGGTLSCSACFTVTSPAPTISSLTPSGGGQGAVNRAVTINGTNFSRGMKVTITDVSVHDVVFLSRTQLSIKVDIPSSAPAGTKDVKVTNNDASQSVTATSAFTVSAPPTVSAVSPTSYGQGAQKVKITVTGKSFASGSTPATTTSVDFGPGITVVSVAVSKGTVVPVVGTTPDDTLVATVNIAEGAGAIARDVTVTNPDGGVGTLAKAFTVNAGPKVTGITPQFLAPNATNVAVTIAGSGFSTTSGKTAVPTIAGVTLKNVTVVSASSITATASVDSGTAKGGKDVVVTNPTDSGAGTCASCLYVATPPNPPTNVTATSTASSVTASWTAPADNGGAPITAYVVSAKNSAGKPVGTPATVSGTARKGTVTGLTNGVKYSIYVIARNVAGDSTPGSTIAQTGAGAQTVLTSSHSPSLTTTGQSVTLSGKLIKISTGTGIAGATIELALVPDVGSATFPKVTTNSAGVWSYRFNPVYSHTIKTIFRGNANGAATQATSYRMGVSTRVTVTSPSNGARSSVRSPLVVRGITSPNKQGSIITLYRFAGGRYVAVQNVRVASNGSYVFTTNLARGDYALKVGIGRTTGNFVGYSPAFGVHRV